MCEACAVPRRHTGGRIGRRTVLGGLAALPLVLARPAPAAAQVPDVVVGDGLAIISRASWGGDLPPRGPLEVEAPGDVRFLLVHHTVSANGYGPGEVPGLLRGIYGFHTGEKGWADVAYNFFVDAHGQVWEGRTGSIDAPVKGDATGGSQGHAMLCCFIGDHQVVAPTPAAQDAMVALLAWLASRYAIDPSPGATTSFVSRGSQKWPAGSSVTTPTITGHRTMSNTVCPGDAAYVLVEDEFPARVTAALAGTPATTSAESTTTTGAPEPSTTDEQVSTTAGSAPTSSSSTTASVSSTTRSAGAGGEDAIGPTEGDGGPDGLAVGLGTAAVAAGITGAALVWRGRRLGGVADDPPLDQS